MNERLRLTLYAIAAGALGILAILGTITGAQHDLMLDAVTALINVASAVLLVVAARNVTADSWSTIRRSLYVAAGALFAALGAFGLIAPEAAATSLDVLTEVLNVVGVLLLGTAAAKVPAEKTRIEGAAR